MSIKLTKFDTFDFYSILHLHDVIHDNCWKAHTKTVILSMIYLNIDLLNPIALRKAKIVYNFGLSECNRVKMKFSVSKLRL